MGFAYSAQLHIVIDIRLYCFVLLLILPQAGVTSLQEQEADLETAPVNKAEIETVATAATAHTVSEAVATTVIVGSF